MKKLLHFARKDATVMGPFWLAWAALIAAQVGMVAKSVGACPTRPAGLALALLALLLVGSSLTKLRPDALRQPERFWQALGAVGASILAGLLANFIVPDSLDPGEYETTLIYFHMLGGAWMVFAYIMAASIVIQDTPVGTSMFWATRPVSGGSLLLAKVLTVTCACVLTPALIWLPWRVHCGYGLADLWYSSWSTMAMAAFAAFTGLIMAAISGNGARFVLYNVVGIALAITGSLLVAVGIGRAQYHGQPEPSLTATRTLLAFVVLLIFAAWAVVNQYRTRRHAWSMSVLISGIILALVLGNFFPYNLSEWLERASVRADFSGLVRIDEFSLQAGDRPASDGSRSCVLNFTLRGVPEGTRCDYGSGRLQFSWAGGQSQVEVERIVNDQSGSETVGISLGFGIQGAPSKVQFHSTQFVLGRETIEQIRKGAATARLLLRAPFSRPRVIEELPLETGSVAAGQGAYVHLLSVQVSDEAPSSTFVRKYGLFGTAVGRQSPGASSAVLGQAIRSKRPTVRVWAGVDRVGRTQYSLCFIYRGGKSFVVNGGQEDGALQFFDSTVAFETADRAELAMPSPLVSATGGWTTPADWRDNTTLGVVKYFPVGTLQRYLQAPSIKME